MGSQSQRPKQCRVTESSFAGHWVLRRKPTFGEVQFTRMATRWQSDSVHQKHILHRLEPRLLQNPGDSSHRTVREPVAEDFSAEDLFSDSRPIGAGSPRPLRRPQ